jgi:hypothetical protein
MENLEIIDEDETFGDRINDFFYFRKRTNNTFQYVLFPEINLKLIENEKLMLIPNRIDYINQIINDRGEQFHDKK